MHSPSDFNLYFSVSAGCTKSDTVCVINEVVLPHSVLRMLGCILLVLFLVTDPCVYLKKNTYWFKSIINSLLMSCGHQIFNHVFFFWFPSEAYVKQLPFPLRDFFSDNLVLVAARFSKVTWEACANSVSIAFCLLVRSGDLFSRLQAAN